jgi:hypothetical protein
VLIVKSRLRPAGPTVYIPGVGNWAIPILASSVSEDRVCQSRVSVSVEPVWVDVPVVRSVDERVRTVTGPIVLWQQPELFICQMASQSVQQSTANAAQQGSKRARLYVLVITSGRRRSGQQQQCCDLQVNGHGLRLRTIVNSRFRLIVLKPRGIFLVKSLSMP